MQQFIHNDLWIVSRDFTGWIKTIKKTPDRPRNQSPQETPTKKSQMLIYPKITYKNLVCSFWLNRGLVPLQPFLIKSSWMGLTQTPFTSRQQLEETGCRRRRVVATLTPDMKYLDPKPCSARGGSEPTQPTHLSGERACPPQCFVPPPRDRDSTAALFASTAQQALLESSPPLLSPCRDAGPQACS